MASPSSARKAQLTGRERAALKNCRRQIIQGGLSWSIPSVLLTWAAFRTRLLPHHWKVPGITIAFVVSNLLGSSSRSDACIDGLLDMKDSQLARNIRKSLPQRARRYDIRKRHRREAEMGRSRSRGEDDDDVVTHISGSSADEELQLSAIASRRGSLRNVEQNQKPLRRNKYGDPIYDDGDYK